MQWAAAPGDETPVNLEVRCPHALKASDAKPKARTVRSRPNQVLIVDRSDRCQRSGDLIGDGEVLWLQASAPTHGSKLVTVHGPIDVQARCQPKEVGYGTRRLALRERKSADPSADRFKRKRLGDTEQRQWLVHGLHRVNQREIAARGRDVHAGRPLRKPERAGISEIAPHIWSQLALLLSREASPVPARE